MESCSANIRQERRKAESISDFLEKKDMAEPHPYYFVDFALPQPLEGSSSETQPLDGRHLDRRVTHSSRDCARAAFLGAVKCNTSFSFGPGTNEVL